MSAPTRSVIIIGAGLAGLAAGVYAQRNGLRSHIFEHASQPGGVAVCWRRGPYTLDGGIHFLMGHRTGALRRLYDDLGTAAPDTLADMTEYGDFVDQATGRRLRITADLAQFVRDWTALAPESAPLAQELADLARDLATADLFKVGMGDPPELAPPFAALRQFWELRSMLRYFTGKYAAPMGQHAAQISDPWLRNVYANLFFPEAPLWFVGTVLALLYSGQLGLLARGSSGFVQPIADRYVALGGQITYGATVEQILVEGDAARGVRLADGTTHRADAVISAADGRSTLFDMLGGRYLDDKWRARYRDWPRVRPMVMINYGVRRTFAGEPHIRGLALAQPLVAAGERVSTLLVRVFNYSDHFAPAGCTVVQVTWDASWDAWNSLHNNSAEYEAEKAAAAAALLERLEAFYPGISAQVELTDVATPHTTWRYTRNDRGAYMGWLPDAQMLMTALPRTLRGLTDFYMAGQWVTPGGGVPTSLLSGRDAVRILCQRAGRTFAS